MFGRRVIAKIDELIEKLIVSWNLNNNTSSSNLTISTKEFQCNLLYIKPLNETEYKKMLMDGLSLNSESGVKSTMNDEVLKKLIEASVQNNRTPIVAELRNIRRNVFESKGEIISSVVIP